MISRSSAAVSVSRSTCRKTRRPPAPAAARGHAAWPTAVNSTCASPAMLVIARKANETTEEPRGVSEAPDDLDDLDDPDELAATDRARCGPGMRRRLAMAQRRIIWSEGVWRPSLRNSRENARNSSSHLDKMRFTPRHRRVRVVPVSQAVGVEAGGEIGRRAIRASAEHEDDTRIGSRIPMGFDADDGENSPPLPSRSLLNRRDARNAGADARLAEHGCSWSAPSCTCEVH